MDLEGVCLVQLTNYYVFGVCLVQLTRLSWTSEGISLRDKDGLERSSLTLSPRMSPT
jgi:hypothetical protein